MFWVIKRNLVSVNVLGFLKWVVSSMVEQEAVNFEVIGSSPILPAKNKYFVDL